MRNVLFVLIASVALLHADTVDYSLNKLSQGHISNINGKVAEDIMNKMLRRNGWRQIEGEVGRNGIDGLFVKLDKEGNVRQVMFAESKYGNSTLGKNKYGTSKKNIKQMSKKGLLYQIDKLLEKYPENKTYKQIRRFVEQDNYRARLFNFKDENGKLNFSIKKILQNGDTDVKIADLKGGEVYKIHGTKIDKFNPKNNYEQRIIQDHESIKAKHYNMYTNAIKNTNNNKSNAYSSKKTTAYKPHYSERHSLSNKSFEKPRFTRRLLTKKLPSVPFSSTARGFSKGASIAAISAIPILGFAAQAAWDAHVSQKLEENEQNIKINRQAIERNTAQIDTNKNNIKLNEQYIQRIMAQQELLGINVNRNTYNISKLTKNIMMNSQHLTSIDDELINLSSQIADAKLLIKENSDKINNITNGIFKTAIDKVNEFYQTNDPQYLDEAITELDKTINIGNLKDKEYLVHYYLVLVRSEKYAVTEQTHELDETRRNFDSLAKDAENNPEAASLLISSYVAISDLPQSFLKDYREKMYSSVKKSIQALIKQNDYDRALDLADYFVKSIGSDQEHELYRYAKEKKIENYEKNENFTSTREALEAIDKNKNSLLNVAAVKYLYKEDDYSDALSVLRNKRFDDDDFRVKAITWIMYLQKHKDDERLKKIISLILNNPTYTEELKRSIKNNICTKEDAKELCSNL